MLECRRFPAGNGMKYKAAFVEITKVPDKKGHINKRSERQTLFNEQLNEI